jgi:hypothetical protein
MGRDGTADTDMAMDLDGTAATDPDGMAIDVVRTGAGSSTFRKAPIENGWRCPLLAHSGHAPSHCTCLLSEAKRTWRFADGRFRGYRCGISGDLFRSTFVG